MARSRAPGLHTAQLNIDQMRVAIPKLERRINDLINFNVSSIRERGDPEGVALVRKMNGTLREILGHGTVEFDEYSTVSMGATTFIRSPYGDGPSLPRFTRNIARISIVRL